MNYEKIWGDILNTIKTKPIELWDYETLNTDSFDSHFYWDEAHTSYKGAEVFTEIIRNRLYKTVE